MGMVTGMGIVMRPVRVVWVSLWMALRELKNLPWIRVAGRERWVPERWAMIVLSIAVMLAAMLVAGMAVTARALATVAVVGKHWWNTTKRATLKQSMWSL